MAKKRKRTRDNPGKAQIELVRRFLQGADAGRAGSLYIHGDTIYSYGPHFPVARVEGATIYVVPKESAPSRTTSGHIGAVERVAEGMGYEIRRVRLARGNPNIMYRPRDSKKPGRETVHARGDVYVFPSKEEKLLDVEIRQRDDSFDKSVRKDMVRLYGTKTPAMRSVPDNPSRNNPPAYFVIEPHTNKILEVVHASKRGMQDAFVRASRAAQEHADRTGAEVVVVVHPHVPKGFRRGTTVSPLFRHYGAKLVTPGGKGGSRNPHRSPSPSQRARGQKSLRGLVRIYEAKRTPQTPVKRLKAAGISFKADYDHRDGTWSIWVAPSKKNAAEKSIRGVVPRRKGKKKAARNAKKPCANPCRNPSHRHAARNGTSNLEALLTPGEAKKARRFA